MGDRDPALGRAAADATADFVTGDYTFVVPPASDIGFPNRSRTRCRGPAGTSGAQPGLLTSPRAGGVVNCPTTKPVSRGRSLRPPVQRAEQAFPAPQRGGSVTEYAAVFQPSREVVAHGTVDRLLRRLPDMGAGRPSERVWRAPVGSSPPRSSAAAVARSPPPGDQVTPRGPITSMVRCSPRLTGWISACGWKMPSGCSALVRLLRSTTSSW